MSRIREFYRFWRSSALCVALSSVLLFTTAIAQDRTFHFDIPEKTLSQALRDFGRAASQEIVFTEDLVAGLKSAPLSGDFTADAALARLLKGTSLTSERSPSGALMIRRQPKSARGTDSHTTSDTVPAPGAREAGATAESPAPQTVATTPPAPAAFAMPEILVKGSRTMNLDITRTQSDAQPYYVFDATTIEQSGTINVEDFLKQRLTMNTEFQSNSQVGGNSFGNTSTINLRGLGWTCPASVDAFPS